MGAGTDTLQVIENLKGSNFNDTLIGTAGNNAISGALGNDTLTGKAAQDKFIFNTPLNVNKNKDLITDFNPPNDVIQLENSIMTLLRSATGTLKASKFFVGSALHDAEIPSFITNQQASFFVMRTALEQLLQF